MNDILSFNGYKFYINERKFVDFNNEEYTLVSCITPALLKNDDLKETLDKFMDSLSSMYDNYNVKMSKFFIKSMMSKLKEDQNEDIRH